jgi:predicted transposase YdaD
VVDSVKPLSPDLPAVERRADWLVRATVHGREGLIQTEFQTQHTDVKIGDMLAYRVQASNRYRLPIFSVIILLSEERYPGPGHNRLAETPFVESDPQLEFRVHEVRIWELDPDLILQKGATGLIPLVPLMRGRGKEPLNKALAAASRLPDNRQKADVLTAIAVFGSLKYSADLLKRLIRSEAMEESPIYQEILREGMVLGEKKGRRQGRLRGLTEGRRKGLTEGRMEGVRSVICHTLQRRFRAVPAEVSARLDGIRSFERLEELAQHAVKCRTLAAFSKLLP